MLLSPALALVLVNRYVLLQHTFYCMWELHTEDTAPLVIKIGPLAARHGSPLDLRYFYNF